MKESVADNITARPMMGNTILPCPPKVNARKVAQTHIPPNRPPTEAIPAILGDNSKACFWTKWIITATKIAKMLAQMM